MSEVTADEWMLYYRALTGHRSVEADARTRIITQLDDRLKVLVRALTLRYKENKEATAFISVLTTTALSFTNFRADASNRTPCIFQAQPPPGGGGVSFPSGTRRKYVSVLHESKPLPPRVVVTLLAATPDSKRVGALIPIHGPSFVTAVTMDYLTALLMIRQMSMFIVRSHADIMCCPHSRRQSLTDMETQLEMMRIKYNKAYLIVWAWLQPWIAPSPSPPPASPPTETEPLAV